jgi:hypothetical protein
MTQIWFADPPPPPEGTPWCLMCLMIAKSYLSDLHAEELAQLAADGKPGSQWFAWDDSIPLQPGRYRGLSDIAALGIIDLCFTHLKGAKLHHVEAPSPLVTPRPRGLVRGQG